VLDATLGWRELAADQAGIIARRQLLACGFTPAQARQQVETGRWQAVHPGVYATFTGPVPDQAGVWAAVLYAGPEACASHETALWLAGALDRPPPAIHISIPNSRRVRAPAGVIIHVSRRFEQRRHPAAQPPRTRLEDAVLDVADDHTDVERMLGLVLQVTQRRLTTTGRLRKALARRSRHRWRSLLAELLAEADDGVASALEHRYFRDVERAHGLPRGQRNRAERRPDRATGNWHRDVRYTSWTTVVELDGRTAHPAEHAFRDLQRDNAATVQGEAVLRYGWHDVVARPCVVAEQVITVLRADGWPGSPRPCAPGCAVSVVPDIA
jgi:hypothetical protein